MEWKNGTLRSMLKGNKEKVIFLFCSGLLLFVISLPNGKTTDSGLRAGTVEVIADVSGDDEFQKIVKLSDKYDWVEHEHCTPLVSHIGKRTIKTVYEYPDKDKYTYKSYRVFASNDQKDGRLLKRKQVKAKGEKFGNTPDHCFIFNDSVVGVKTPPELDRQWYIDLAKKRLKQFGVVA